MAFRRVLIVTLFAAAAAACGSSSSSPSSTTPPPTSTGGSATVSIPTNARNLGAAGFGTNPLIVSTGTTVTWVNNDTIPHDSIADGGQWSSPVLSPGQSFQFRFASAGTFTYKCTLHAGMVGTVTVQ